MRRSKKPPWTGIGTNNLVDTGSNYSRRDSFQMPQPSESQEKTGALPRANLSSLLIVCLVEQLCSFIEKDAIKTRALNEFLLNGLRDLEMIDDFCTADEFESMRQKFKHDLCSMVSKAQTKTCEPNRLQTIVPIRATDEVDTGHPMSRYATDFKLLNFISRGGFGQVFSVMNRLDGCKYAIKKIFVRSQNALYHSIINEVTVLARLQHPNIVKYYTAWLEPFPCEPVPSISIIEESSDHHQPKLLGVSNQEHMCNHSSRKLEESSGSSFIQFRSEDAEVHDWSYQGMEKVSVHRETSFNIYREGLMHNVDQSSSSEQESLSDTGAVIPRHSLNMMPGRALLYIQMELCGRSLRQWLDFSPVDAEPTSMLGFLQLQTRLSFFWQLASALEYLHKQNIVHHDIKPSNIFVFGNNRVKLGDFGLACSYENSKSQVHHAWGTNTYAAPEQLNGGLCNFKSDVYSTGLVLLELLMPPFHTSSERIHVLSHLRYQNKVPDTINTQLHQWSELLRCLTTQDPDLRPSASELRIKVQDLLCQHIADVHEQSRHGNSIEEKNLSNLAHFHTNSVRNTFIKKNIKSETKNPEIISSHNVTHSEKYTFNVTNNICHDVTSAVNSRTLETRDDMFVRDSVTGEERFEPFLRLARVQELEVQVETLKHQLEMRENQIRALKEQVRLLSLQLQH